MNKVALLLFLIFIVMGKTAAQDKKPQDFGYRHLQINYKKDPVDILIMSKEGDEQKAKPILLFDQGSQARPLILLKEDGTPYRLFPFLTDSLLVVYHLAIIGKPYVSLIAYH